MLAGFYPRVALLLTLLHVCFIASFSVIDFHRLSDSIGQLGADRRRVRFAISRGTSRPRYWAGEGSPPSLLAGGGVLTVVLGQGRVGRVPPICAYLRPCSPISLTLLVADCRSVGSLVVPAMPAQRILDVPAAGGC